jgi:hypothetical protein
MEKGNVCRRRVDSPAEICAELDFRKTLVLVIEAVQELLL